MLIWRYNQIINQYWSVFYSLMQPRSQQHHRLQVQQFPNSQKKSSNKMSAEIEIEEHSQSSEEHPEQQIFVGIKGENFSQFVSQDFDRPLSVIHDESLPQQSPDISDTFSQQSSDFMPILQKQVGNSSSPNRKIQQSNPNSDKNAKKNAQMVPQKKQQPKKHQKQKKLPLIRKIPNDLKFSYIEDQPISAYSFIEEVERKKGGIYELTLPNLSGQLITFLKFEQNKPKKATFEMNHVQLFLPKIDSIQLRAVTKIKILKNADNKKLIKLTYSNIISKQKTQQIRFFLFRGQDNNLKTFRLFAGIIIRKLLLQNFLVNEPIAESPTKKKQGHQFYLQGQIYKKGILFSPWEKKKTVITDKLYFYKDQKVPYVLDHIDQYWTRFDMYQGHFIMKMWRSSQKIQIGIPILNYTQQSKSFQIVILASKQKESYLLCFLF